MTKESINILKQILQLKNNNKEKQNFTNCLAIRIA